MIKVKSIILPSEFDHIYFIPIGDFHTGDPAGFGGSSKEGKYATKKLRDMIKWIKDKPYAYTFLMGDLFDAVTKTSLGSVYEQEYNLKTAKDYLTEELKPIKEKILGCIDGNHEQRIIKTIGDSPVNDLSYRLGIEYFPNWCAYLFLNVGESRGNKRMDKRRPICYSAFLHHMTGGGRTQGGKVNRIMALKGMALADLYCGAHVHSKIALKEKYIYPDMHNKKLMEQQECFVATGSYMGYASYSLEAMFIKPATGSTRIRLNGEQTKGKDIHASV